MRPCAVKNCKNSDLTILAHRFPKKLEPRQSWKTALKLKQPLDILLDKYVVCKNHFKISDYRNPVSKCLNTTAIPQLIQKPEVEMEIVTEAKSDEESESPIECYSISGLPNSSESEEKTASPQKRKLNTEETYEVFNTQEIKNPPKKRIKDLKLQENLSEESIEIEALDEAYSQTDAESSSSKNDKDEEDPELSKIYTEHPQYKNYKTVDLIKNILAKEEKIKELEEKLEKFSTAMSAFKMLMNS